MTIYSMADVPTRPQWRVLAKMLEVGDMVLCEDVYDADIIRRSLYNCGVTVRRIRIDGKLYLKRIQL